METGKRVSLDAHAPLTFPAILSAAGTSRPIEVNNRFRSFIQDAPARVFGNALSQQGRLQSLPLSWAAPLLIVCSHERPAAWNGLCRGSNRQTNAASVTTHRLAGFLRVNVPQSTVWNEPGVALSMATIIFARFFVMMGS
jgi:hypothetical protein